MWIFFNEFTLLSITNSISNADEMVQSQPSYMTIIAAGSFELSLMSFTGEFTAVCIFGSHRIKHTSETLTAI